VWAAVAERHAETLRAADRNVRAEFARRFEEREREQIGGDGEHRAGGVGLFREAGEIVDRAGRVGILHERAENFFVERKRFVMADDDFNIERMSAGTHHFDSLRMAILGNEENVSPVANTQRHSHRFGRCGGFVQHGSIRDIERREVGDQRLKIQERFEPALGNFGLIGSVLRIPAGIFQHAALDDRRRDGVVIALADEGAEHFVLAGDAAEFSQRVEFAARGRQIYFFFEPDFLRHGGVNEFVQIFLSEQRQHGTRVCRVGTDVAMDKLVGMREWIPCLLF